MDAATLLKTARERAGLSQRELARRCRIHQPAIARIESGKVDPGIATLRRLLNGCGHELSIEPKPGFGVDRTLIREHLALTPAERLERIKRYASFIKSARAGIQR